MISDVLSEEFIQLDVEVNDFEQAIIASMKPLLESGAVTDNYIEEIISISKSLGPYIVITPNIALPHAPVEAGANRLALGFTRLMEPVISGHKENDPVKYLFPLSAEDQNSHISVLAELADCLSDPEFISLLGEVQSSTELINYFKQKEGIDENV